MTDSPMPHPRLALVPPDEADAYIAAGWRVLRQDSTDGNGNPRVLLGWVGNDEPRLPAGVRR